MDFIQVVSQVGFPIAVATFALIRLDKTISLNTTAITEMSKAILLLKNKTEEK